jgi:hypothetical protein
MRTFFRIVISVLGVLLALMGAVWFLQGINVLPGSLMSGQTQWVIYGAIAVIIGIALLVGANRWCGFTRNEGCQA